MPSIVVENEELSSLFRRWASIALEKYSLLISLCIDNSWCTLSPSVSLALSFSHTHTQTHTPFCERKENFPWRYTVKTHFDLDTCTCKQMWTHILKERLCANHQAVYFIWRLRKGLSTDNFTKKRDSQNSVRWHIKLGPGKSRSDRSVGNFKKMAMSAITDFRYRYLKLGPCSSFK